MFIDPYVALGYDYEIGNGDPNFASVLLPEIGNNIFSLYLFNGTGYEFEAYIGSGEEYFFNPDGEGRFRIMGIEESAGLDQNNATAFSTALTFVSDGSFTGTMIPIVANQVEIDIKSGSDPNCFNPNEHGVIPVAIFGTSNLDVDDIHPNSLLLQGLAVKMVGKRNRYLVHTDFVNEDEYPDLVVQFEDNDSWIGAGEDVVRLIGTLYDGTPIEAEDHICIVSSN